MSKERENGKLLAVAVAEREDTEEALMLDH